MLPTDLHNCVLVSVGDKIFVERLSDEEKDIFSSMGTAISDLFGRYSQQDTQEWLDLLELSYYADHQLHVALWIMRKAGAHLAPDNRFGMRLYANYGESHGWFEDKAKWGAITKLLLAPKRSLLMELLQKVKEKKVNRENEFC